MIFDMGKNAHKYKNEERIDVPLGVSPLVFGIDFGLFENPYSYQRSMTATEAQLLRRPSESKDGRGKAKDGTSYPRFL